jgi:hypothetical protein
LALYHGTTLVVPHRTNKNLGFSPCAFTSPGKSRQGLKPNSLSLLYGPTKVVP